LLFTGALGREMDGLGRVGAGQRVDRMGRVDGSERQAVMAQAADLGNAKVPEAVPAADRASVSVAYHNAFISAYAGILRISAALALSGALMAFIFVKKGRVD